MADTPAKMEDELRSARRFAETSGQPKSSALGTMEALSQKRLPGLTPEQKRGERTLYQRFAQMLFRD